MGRHYESDPVPVGPHHVPTTFYRERRTPTARMLLIVAVIGAITFGIVGVILQRGNVLPAGVPLLGKDTGIAACEALAQSAGTPGSDQAPATILSDGDKQKLRGVFEDSRYAEIREPGVRFVDLALQIEAMGPDAGLAALPLVGPLTESYAALAGGCGQHGHALPALFGR